MGQEVIHAADIVRLVSSIWRRARRVDGPFVVAIDGRSGAGKSTLAGYVAEPLGAVVISGDDFFRGGVTVRADSPRERANDCIAWRELRPVLQDLREERCATYRPFDWDAFDGRLSVHEKRLNPSRFVVLEGVYSTRPELSDLIDLRVLLSIPHELRLTRLIAREGALTPWELQWHEAEDFYFESVVPEEHFDVVLTEVMSDLDA